ncbi:SixA phosphatase family protein [Nocardioides coralli]|uniref:SixA phosphatase family protein n=1 Tax=Nocardioides coralli TaxID=2872154 RepID=UPI001CA43E2D|nr:histidine phosphatase family protein [Nocardioides coralli]QZY27623.1 histidine phosphatase family protein [Nocardioides coralli]
MQQPRHLVLVRHARAEQSGRTDAERTLTEEGDAAARERGAELAAEGLVPDHALVSAAVRAVQTWEALAAGAGWELGAETSRSLYTAEPETALDLLGELPAQTSTVVVVGHNPTMASLAQTLDDGRGDPDAGAALLAAGFPPGAAAVFAYDGAWADVAPGSARLVAYRS